MGGDQRFFRIKLVMHKSILAVIIPPGNTRPGDL